MRLSAKPQVFARLSGSRATSVPSSAIGERLWSAEAGSLNIAVASTSFPLLMSLLSPAPPHLPGAMPPERRAALELRRAQLRAAPRTRRALRAPSNLLP